MRTSLITGITGQDGSYLAELLLEKGYRVVGTVDRGGTRNIERIRHMLNDIELAEADLLDQEVLAGIIHTYRPDEVYNLAARASSRILFDQPVLTGEINGLAVARLLEAIRTVGQGTRFCQASSSEMFGNTSEVPQCETTPFHPRNPYGVAKLYGHWITVNYRESYGLFACSSILFNHESPRRGLDYVSRKIAHGVAQIKQGRATVLRLGNLDARRDWGFARDYVHAMWLMLQRPQPDDFVVATGQTHSVREFCEVAFNHVGLSYRDHVVVEPGAIRQATEGTLVGDPTRAARELGWKATVGFEDLVRMMVDAELVAGQDSPNH